MKLKGGEKDSTTRGKIKYLTGDYDNFPNEVKTGVFFALAEEYSENLELKIINSIEDVREYLLEI